MDEDEDKQIETAEEGSHDEDESKKKERESSKGKSKKDKKEPEWKKFGTMPLEEKRKYYRCGHDFVMLDDIETWTKYFDEQTYLFHKVPKPGKRAFPFNKKLNDKVSLWIGDITTLEIDAIVNAANERLLGGGGVDGCIHRAAGQTLKEECFLLNGCKTGNTKLTLGHKLPAKYVLHTVGPIGKQEDKLESCYETCLSLCLKHEIRTVAFCCISTGIFGYPNKDAAEVALRTTRQMLEDNADAFDRIIFCLFLEKDIDIYHSLMLKYFPPREEEDIKKSEKIKRADKEEPNKDKNNKPNDEVTTEKASKKPRQDGDDNKSDSTQKDKNKEPNDKVMTEKTSKEPKQDDDNIGDSAQKQSDSAVMTEKTSKEPKQDDDNVGDSAQKQSDSAEQEAITQNTEDMETPEKMQSKNSPDKVSTANVDKKAFSSSTGTDPKENTQMEGMEVDKNTKDKPVEESVDEKEIKSAEDQKPHEPMQTTDV